MFVEMSKCRPHGEAWGEIEDAVEEAARTRERSVERLRRRQPSPRGGERQFSLPTVGSDAWLYTHYMYSLHAAHTRSSAFR